MAAPFFTRTDMPERGGAMVVYNMDTARAVADLASLAGGQIDAYMHSGLKPWDVAASALLIEKAGGKITTPTGDKWNVFNPDILVSNDVLHERLLNLLNLLTVKKKREEAVLIQELNPL